LNFRLDATKLPATPANFWPITSNFRRTFRIFRERPYIRPTTARQTADTPRFSAELFAGGRQRRKSGRSPVLPAILPAPRPTKNAICGNNFRSREWNSFRGLQINSPGKLGFSKEKSAARRILKIFRRKSFIATV